MYAHWNESDQKGYANVRRQWLKVYSKTDDILYDMCNRWPGHKDFGTTQAKVRIIGRVYQTGLERLGKKDERDGIYETVAKLFSKNKGWLDRELQILRSFKQPQAASEPILALHGRLVRLLKTQMWATIEREPKVTGMAPCKLGWECRNPLGAISVRDGLLLGSLFGLSSLCLRSSSISFSDRTSPPG